MMKNLNDERERKTLLVCTGYFWSVSIDKSTSPEGKKIIEKFYKNKS